MMRLLPCPFCGGEAGIVDIDEGENAGGSCVCCTGCMASSNVEFGFKENLVSNWNCRATLSTLDAAFAAASKAPESTRPTVDVSDPAQVETALADPAAIRRAASST